MQDIKKVQNGLNPQLTIFGILATKVQVNPTITKKILSLVNEMYPNLLLPHRIKFAIKNVAASAEGIPLVIYDKQDETAQEYIKLSKTIYEQEQK